MNTLSNPGAVHKPAGPYHHTVLVSENARWLAISGSKVRASCAIQ